MNKPILIVRTVSIEKLHVVIECCKQRWPDCPLWVLTLPGREDELLHDDRIDDVLLYASPSKTFCERLEMVTQFNAMIIPIANQKGWGYGNVFRALSLVRTCNTFLVTRCQQLKTVSRLRLQSQSLLEYFLEYVIGRFTQRKANAIYVEATAQRTKPRKREAELTLKN